MDPRKGLGAEWRLGGWIRVQTWRKWATWVSRRERYLSFSVVWKPTQDSLAFKKL